MSRTDRTVLVAVLAVALGLRAWNLTAGLPYAVGVDEPQLVERAVRMMKTGDYHPHFFDYPGLYIYVQLLLSVARFLAGAFLGEFRSLAAFTGEHLYPAARFLTAVIGVATVWLTMRIGLRWGRREALGGALLLAVMPMHVRESHYVLTDVPVTFFVHMDAAGMPARGRAADPRALRTGWRRRGPGRRHEVQRRHRRSCCRWSPSGRPSRARHTVPASLVWSSVRPWRRF